MNARHKTKTENSIWQRIRNSMRLRLQGNGGFTLVELIVVLVVLGILATLAVMSLIGWQDYADFKRNNEYAQNIFSAAQIQLTQYGERGQLTELIEAVTDDGKAERKSYMLSEQGSLTDSNGNSYNVGDIWQDENQGNIYYLKVKKGDYKTYIESLKGKSASDMKKLSESENRAELRQIKALFDMIDPYIADKSMLDAAICIEFDPDPKVALVYSVFYNEKANEFTYGEGSSATGLRIISIQDRSVQERKKDKTGYYGAETMAKGTDTFISRPVITNLRLNNEETLNLTWSTKGNGTDLTELIYNINLYQAADNPAEDGTLLMSLVLGSVDTKNLDSTLELNGNRVECSVNNKKTGVEETYWFPVLHDKSERTLTLVLDGLDLSVDENTAIAAMKESASIRRFRLNGEDIYAAISGSRPGVYDLTVEKRSNTEHSLFGSRKTREDGSVIYGVENARHLNNIRYKEKEYESNDGILGSPVFHYQVSRDISWEYALNQETVYDRGIVQKPDGDVSGYYFRPLAGLRRDSVLESDDSNKSRSLKRFRMDISHMGLAEGETSAIGLVAENRGLIQNLILEDVYVNGIGTDTDHSAAYTGAFCGKNDGTVYNLTVQDSGSLEENRADQYNQVRGVTYVGGIAGYASGNGSADNPGYEKLVNRIAVTGQQSVGGIVGSLTVQEGKVEVVSCENYGKIRGLIQDTAKGAYYFGGIAGRVERAEGMSGTVEIRECVSSPYYSEAEAEKLLEDINNPETVTLIENFAGGIVGFNDAALIKNCSTVREALGKQGYIVGRDFVGGIAGYNAGIAGALASGDENSRNQAHVIGRSYVGGIVGCNALGEVDETKEPYTVKLREADPDLADADRAAVKGWINEGIITATGNYAGGITGFNGATGVIEESYSNVEYDSGAEKMAKVSTKARFAGGVAGYNQGKLWTSLTNQVSVVSVVSGKDYVGGVVGCNDVGGEIQGYALKGGYIDGKHFVGGYVGLNMDKTVFTNPRIDSNPNRVTGDYFVGGVIGGNLVPVEESEAVELEARLKTDNFLGTLAAEQGAFAGGFIGYNYLLKEEVADLTADNNTGENSGAADALQPKISLILHETNLLCEKLRPLSGEDVSADNPEEEVRNLLSRYANTKAGMTITGISSEAAGQEQLGGIRAKIYVGGVVGYNNPNTILLIKNVENITPVEATGYIEFEEGISGKAHNYSYAGGVIGKVEQNVTLDGCRNRDVGEVRTMGTYTGGLAEINYGTIRNSRTGNIGDGTKSYVGGLVGVNAAKKQQGSEDLIQGTVTDCVISGQISGVNYVGGLAAENYGIIEYTKQSDSDEATVDASGSFAGGITGYAHKSGEIRLKSSLELDINVTGSAAYVGGIAGVNSGTITVQDGKEISNTRDNTIIGRMHVGGFIGMQTEPESKMDLSGLYNYAQVQASSGFAGGIAAVVRGTKEILSDGSEKWTSNVTIEKCENYGSVAVLSAEDAGDDQEIPEEPIEPEKPGSGGGDITDEGGIPDEEDEIAAAAGGITAVNYGSIISCVNVAEVKAGDGYIGGIAAINHNTIRNCEVGSERDESDAEIELTGDQYVGGIAAINKENAVIEHCAVKNLFLYNQVNSDGGFMGGVTAQNLGAIRNCQVGVSFEAVTTTTQEDEKYKGLRKAAAKNASEGIAAGSLIKGGNTIGYSVALISNAAEVRMGGIAGSNDEKGKIQGSYKDGPDYSVVSADLRFAAGGNSYYGNLGGIVGENFSEVSGYEFSGYVRGTANDPAHAPEFNANYDLEPTGNRVYGYGGIAGINGSDRNDSSASIRNCYLGMVKVQGTGAASNRANVGGVTGFNGTGGIVSDITFSQQNEVLDAGQQPFSYQVNKTPVRSTFNGTVWVDAATYGHVGGVVGYNHGIVSDINWDPRYPGATGRAGLDKEQTENKYALDEYFLGGKLADGTVSDVDSTGALVTTAAGHIGGIVGYNRRTGSLSHAVTGRNWLVYSEKSEQDNGIGGIIGYNISERDMQQCDNHATVVKMAGNAVGGVVGRNENGTTSSWKFTDCRNYGKIYAEARAGGIVGNWKYKGGTLEQCINYGFVHANKDGVGGILGRTYGISVGETINIVRSENHGEVSAGSNSVPVGGIVGHAFQNQNIGIYGCINTGMINDGNGNISSGGILGKADDAMKKSVEILDCRNYGYSKSGNSNFCGITRSDVSVKGCFGVTANDNTMYPVRDKKNIRNYYFTKGGATATDDFWVDSIVAVGNADNSNRGRLWNVVSGKYDSNRGNFFFNKESSSSLAFEFNRPVKLSQVTIEWPDNRKTTYSIQFANGDEPVSVSGREGTIIQEDRISGSKTYDLDGQTVTGVYLSGITAIQNGATGEAAIYQFRAKSENDGKMNYSSESADSVDMSSSNRTVYSAGNSPEALVIKKEADGKTYAVKATISKRVLNDLGKYTQEDIDDVRRKTDSRYSYILCKGSETRKGLDSYLIPVEVDDTPSVPQNVEKSPENGEYRISWDASDNAQYYIATCVYHVPENGDVEVSYIAYTPSVLIPSSVEKNGKAADSVTVTVAACSGGISSDASDALEFNLGHPLVYPQIRWRLKGLGSDGEGKYYVTLENRSEYEEFVKAYLISGGKEPTTEEIEEELEKIKIHTSGMGSISFNAKDGGEKIDGKEVLYPSPKPDKTDNITFTCYAEYKGNDTATDGAPIEQSLKVVRESLCPREKDYDQQGNPTGQLDGRVPKFANVEIAKTANSKGIGFSGITAKELTYNLKLSRGGSSDINSWVADYRSEIIAEDPVLKVPVAFSVSEQTKISTTTNTSSEVKLSNLPEDFLNKDLDAVSREEKYRYQKVMVRTYPTKMSNDVVFQGWNVNYGAGESQKEEFTADQLKNLTVSDKGEILALDGGMPNLIVGHTVKDGYGIVWKGTNESGETVYKLYFNALLKSLEESGGYKEENSWKYKGEDTDSTYMKYQIFYHFIDLEKEIENVQEEPVIFAQAKYNAEKDKWEDGDYDGSDQFVLTWDQAATGGTPAYTGDRDESLYKDATYRLLLTGIKGDKETVLVNNEEFVTKTRTGVYNTYSADPSKVRTWDYDKLHISLTRLGTVDDNNITIKFPSTVEKELPMRRRLPQVEDVTIALKRNDDGVVMKDGLDYVVKFTGVGSDDEKAALECYKIMIASRETENPTETQEILTQAPDATEVDVNLAKFRRNEKIVITVQAIAKDSGTGDHTGYRDGLISAPREMTVPNRLYRPQMGKATPDAVENNLTEIDHKDHLSVSEFEAGCITLQMKKETYTDQNLRYQIALELYDSEEKANEGMDPIDTQTTVLPTKGKPGEMLYKSTQENYIYVLKELPANYAGKWLRIVLRSVGSNSISSLWTDEEDEGNEEESVERYMVFKLPNVQIEAVQYAELAPDDTEDVVCEVLNAGEKIPGMELTATQQLIAFDTVEHASQYHIIMVQTPQQADKKATSSNADVYQVSDVNDMMLTENADGTYHLTYWTTEGADVGSQPTQTIERFEVGTEAQLPLYREAISVDTGENKGNYIETFATIQLLPGENDGTVRVQMRLPDCQDISDSQGGTLGVQKRTEQILVQAVTGEDNDSYLDSQWSILYWSDDDLSGETVLDMTEAAVEPDEITVGDSYRAKAVTGYADVAYVWKGFTSTVRMLASVSDSAGHELGVFGVPVYSAVAADGAKSQQVWLPNGFARYEDRNLKIKFRSIFDAADTAGGLSESYTGEYLVTLPALPETSVTAVVSGLSEAKEYPVNLTADTGASRRSRRQAAGNSDGTRLLTARQKQLTWEYDLSDARTTGYDLELRGSQMDTPYRLNIDLHRELFGVMPGIKEFLAEDGKLLYTVSYDVDGEMLLQWESGAEIASPSDAEPGLATPSDQKPEMDKATDSNMTAGLNRATSSNSQPVPQPGILTLECRLKAEYVMDDEDVAKIRFTLLLPDISYDYLEEDAAELYAAQFPDGLYQTEELTLTPVMVNRYYRKEDTVLDLTELRGEIENDLVN